jgi:hypothetical protein
MSEDDANDLIRKDALKLYRQWACNILQDGEITPEEEEGLRWLRREFGLPTEDTAKYDDQIVEAKQLAAYRRGELPTIESGKILQRGETCHWETRCCFEWETATKTKNANGELIITSHQIVFTSPLKTFSFSPAKIVDVIIYTNAVALRTSISRGSGTYFIPGSKFVEAVLVGLARRHKLLHLSSGFTSDRSRRIPQAVRQEVFLRDGGRCVQCGADYPIHYDHILPFSRGGSNTVENIQILCGPCNLRKSDSI